MASQAEINRLRSLVEPTDLTDPELAAIFDASKNMNEAASAVWQTKAALYSTIVDVAESGSSRKMGDMFTHALKLAEYHGGAGAETDHDAGGRTRIRKIVRE